MTKLQHLQPIHESLNMNEGLITSLIRSYFDGQSKDSLIKIFITGILADKALTALFGSKVDGEVNESTLWKFFKDMAIGYIINMIMDAIFSSPDCRRNMLGSLFS